MPRRSRRAISAGRHVPGAHSFGVSRAVSVRNSNAVRFVSMCNARAARFKSAGAIVGCRVGGTGVGCGVGIGVGTVVGCGVGGTGVGGGRVISGVGTGVGYRVRRVRDHGSIKETQAVLPRDGAANPGLHAWHMETPILRTPILPAKQSLHARAPILGWYMPRGHCLQCPAWARVVYSGW